MSSLTLAAQSSRWSIVAVCSAALMLPLSFSAGVIATPAIAVNPGGSALALSWVTNAFLLSFGSLLMAAGALADRFGAGTVFVVGCAGLLITSWTFYHSLLQHPDWLFPLYSLSGLFVGTIGAVPYVMVKAFPPVVRFSGLSFSYNLAYAIFGGLTPMAVTLLLKESPMGPAYYVAIICTMGLVVGAYLWKKGR